MGGRELLGWVTHKDKKNPDAIVNVVREMKRETVWNGTKKSAVFASKPQMDNENMLYARDRGKEKRENGQGTSPDIPKQKRWTTKEEDEI